MKGFSMEFRMDYALVALMVACNLWMVAEAIL